MIVSMASSRIIINKCDFITNLRKSCLPLTYIRMISTTNQIYLEDKEESNSRDLQLVKEETESKVEVKKPASRRSLFFSEEKPLCPYTGRRKFVTPEEAASWQDDPDPLIKAMKPNFWAMLTDFHGTIFPEDSPEHQRVARISSQIFDYNSDLPEIEGKNWIIQVVDKPDYRIPVKANAWASPNGKIFVTSNFLNRINCDETLAMIIAEEISHQCLNHPAEHPLATEYWNIIGSVAICLSSYISILGLDFPKMMILPLIAIFGRYFWRLKKISAERINMMELEADELGFRLITKAGFDIREPILYYASNVSLEKLDKNSLKPSDGYPTPEARILNLIEIFPKAIELRNNCGWPKFSNSDKTAQELDKIFKELSSASHKNKSRQEI